MPARKPDFDACVRAELALLYRVARRLTLDSSDAEDVVGSALLAASRGWEGFDGRYPRSWLVRIVQNEFFRAARRKSARPELDLEVAGEIADGGEEGFWREISGRLDAADLRRELDLLPEGYRLAVALCDVEEMTYEEAALAMDLPLNTLRTRVYRGRRLLRARLVHLAD